MSEENKDIIPQSSITSSYLKIILSGVSSKIPIAACYDEYIYQKEMDRITQFLSSLQKRLEQIEKKHCNIDEEDWHLLELSIRKVKIESRKRKIELFANLLSSCWTTKKQDCFEKKYRFLEAINKFDELHLNILHFLEVKNEFIPTSTIKEQLKISNIHAELLPALSLLATEYGFIYRTWGADNNILSTKNLSPEAIAYKCKCKITKTGVDFLEYIRNSDENNTNSTATCSRERNSNINSR